MGWICMIMCYCSIYHGEVRIAVHDTALRNFLTEHGKMSFVCFGEGIKIKDEIAL